MLNVNIQKDPVVQVKSEVEKVSHQSNFRSEDHVQNARQNQVVNLNWVAD